MQEDLRKLSTELLLKLENVDKRLSKLERNSDYFYAEIQKMKKQR